MAFPVSSATPSLFQSHHCVSHPASDHHGLAATPAMISIAHIKRCYTLSSSVVMHTASAVEAAVGTMRTIVKTPMGPVMEVMKSIMVPVIEVAVGTAMETTVKAVSHARSAEEHMVHAVEMMKAVDKDEIRAQANPDRRPVPGVNVVGARRRVGHLPAVCALHDLPGAIWLQAGQAHHLLQYAPDLGLPDHLLARYTVGIPSACRRHLGGCGHAQAEAGEQRRHGSKSLAHDFIRSSNARRHDAA